MREVTILKFCDLCWEESQTKVAGVATFTIGVTEGETAPTPRILECCEAHMEMFAILRDLMARLPKFDKNLVGLPPAFAAAAGRAASAPASGPGSRGPNNGSTPVEECPVCELRLTRTGVVSHLWNRHITPEFGLQRPPAPTKCPDCGYEGATAGVGVHRMNMHGYNAIELTYQVYLDAKAGKVGTAAMKEVAGAGGIDQLELTAGASEPETKASEEDPPPKRSHKRKDAVVAA